MSLRKFFEPFQKKTVIYADSSSEPGKSCEDLLWHHRPQLFLFRDEWHQVKEGTSAVLLQSKLDERCWSDSTDEMSKTSWKTGKLCMKGDLENHSKDQHFFLEQRLIIIRFQRDLSRLFPFGKKVPPVIFLGSELIAGRIWK